MRTTLRFFSLAALAVASAVLAIPAAAMSAVRTVARYVTGMALDACATAARTERDASAAPSPVLVQARAFVLRLAKRERPVLSQSWRMCPST